MANPVVTPVNGEEKKKSRFGFGKDLAEKKEKKEKAPKEKKEKAPKEKKEKAPKEKKEKVPKEKKEKAPKDNTPKPDRPVALDENGNVIKNVFGVPKKKPRAEYQAEIDKQKVDLEQQKTALEQQKMELDRIKFEVSRLQTDLSSTNQKYTALKNWANNPPPVAR